jgi:hypothetical protein
VLLMSAGWLASKFFLCREDGSIVRQTSEDLVYSKFRLPEWYRVDLAAFSFFYLFFFFLFWLPIRGNADGQWVRGEVCPG